MTQSILTSGAVSHKAKQSEMILTICLANFVWVPATPEVRAPTTLNGIILEEEGKSFSGVNFGDHWNHIATP